MLVLILLILLLTGSVRDLARFAARSCAALRSTASGGTRAPVCLNQRTLAFLWSYCITPECLPAGLLTTILLSRIILLLVFTSTLPLMLTNILNLRFGNVILI